MKIERDERRDPKYLPYYQVIKAIEKKEELDRERKNKYLKFKSFFRSIFSF